MTFHKIQNGSLYGHISSCFLSVLLFIDEKRFEVEEQKRIIDSFVLIVCIV